MLATLAMLLGCTGVAHAETSFAEALVEEARRFVMAQVIAPGRPRTEVSMGRLDTRLRLAPCDKILTYLPSGTRLVGKTRVGLRCVQGVTPWSVYVPVTVNIFGNALVSSSVLPAGHVLSAEDFRQAEVNLAEDTMNPPITDAAVLLGRTLAKPMAPGQSLRADSLKARQWFAAGDPVQIRVAGSGFAVAGVGEALTAGLEGLPARVRTESGRVISGMPVAERQLELAL